MASLNQAQRQYDSQYDVYGDMAAAEVEEISRRLSLLERDPDAIKQAIGEIEFEHGDELMKLRVRAFLTNQDADRKVRDDREAALITSSLLIRAKCEADEAYVDMLYARRTGAQP